MDESNNPVGERETSCSQEQIRVSLGLGQAAIPTLASGGTLGSILRSENVSRPVVGQGLSAFSLYMSGSGTAGKVSEETVAGVSTALSSALMETGHPPLRENARCSSVAAIENILSDSALPSTFPILFEPHSAEPSTEDVAINTTELDENIR